MQALSKLKQLMEAGLVTPAEYEAKKKEILSRL
ncbi:MAG TPA: SHOCT domain-containing protein [Promineifilum sp.]|nr:SHOCT domain-containing protein [Promineifilum sp.]